MSDLERLIADTQQLLDQATPGPWTVERDAVVAEHPQYPDLVPVVFLSSAYRRFDATGSRDLDLIAAAPGLLAALLDVARRHQQVEKAAGDIGDLATRLDESVHDVPRLCPEGDDEAMCEVLDAAAYRMTQAARVMRRIDTARASVGEVPTTGGTT